MSCMSNINRFIVPNDVIANLCEIYKYIGKSSSYYKVTASDLSRIIDQTIERDTYFLAKLINIDLTDSRMRLIIAKNSTPRTLEEKTLYTIKELLTDFLRYPEKQRLDSTGLLNLINYIYPKSGIKYDYYKDDKRNIPVLAGKSKREILDELFEKFDNSSKEGSVEGLILTINYFLDICALKPFNLHNEAIPYLVLYVLLNKYHYNAISYVSLFETIYFHKAEFDDELQNAISNWGEGISQILPFVRYLIEKLKELYEHCDHIISSYVEDSNLNKGDNIENTILNDLPNIFTKEEIRLNHPYVSESTINRALKKLHEENIIRPLGQGRSAKWLKVGMK